MKRLFMKLFAGVFVTIGVSLLMLLALLIFCKAYAGQTCSETAEQATEQKVLTTDVPKHLEGATIIVRLKDGRESVVPAERFKVVPRKQQFLVTKVKSTTLCMASEKNRVSVLGGYGPKGSLSKTVENTDKVTVKTNEGAVGGLQLQRKVSDNLSVGVQGQTNKTFSFIFGVDF